MSNTSLKEKAGKAIQKFSDIKFVKCMSAAVTAGMGATIAGSIFMILQNPPFPADMTGGFIDAWRAWASANSSWLGLGYQVTIEFLGLYALIGMIMAVSDINKIRPVNMLIVGICTYLLLAVNLVEGQLDIRFMGSKGLITALIVGYLVVESAQWLMKHGFKLKLPDAVPPFVAEPLNALFVNIIILAAAVAIRLITAAFTGGQLLPNTINMLFAPLFVASDSLFGVILYVLFLRLLWFFGIHGGSVANAVMSPILSVAMTANAEAFMQDQPLPYIFNSSFVAIWTQMGILTLALTLVIAAKSKQLKAISKVSLVPAFFNIGEPLTFGVPIVMNFRILVPYLLVFVLNGVVPYIATSIGLINRTFVNLPYTVPSVVKAFLGGMDIRSVILYLILVVADILIYLPWIKRYDKELTARENEA